MIASTKETGHILQLIEKFGPVRSSNLVNLTGLSTKTIHKHLSRLVTRGQIIKTGNVPKVFYTLSPTPISKITPIITQKTTYLDQHYLYVSPSGEIIRGYEGFIAWCDKNNYDLETEIDQFIGKHKLSQKYAKHGLISAKKILATRHAHLYLDDIFFSDFYTLDYFGRTKLGQLVYLGKSSQNIALIQEIVSLIKPDLMNLIDKYHIKHLCFIPPTIDRQIQFQTELRRYLDLDIPHIIAQKINTLTKVAQKTLRKLEDRIENATTTISVDPTQTISGNILMIDDATGSGATLNQTAKKIQAFAPQATQIYGYSVVGSYKGFDVISEV